MTPHKLEFGHADPATLKPNPWNTNHLSPEAEAKLDNSLKRRGMFKPVVVRTLDDGSLQLLGGEHRAQSAVRVGLRSVPLINLGRVSDKEAKEIGLLDNSRYGTDNALDLAKLLGEIGTVDEIAQFMPYNTAEVTAIFSTLNIDLDALDLPEDAEAPQLPSAPKVQTHQVMRFKVPVDDVEDMTEMVEKVMKTQKFTDEDALSNAGNALVWILNDYMKGGRA
ncbi:ParB N-terminal domain-containing protein [Cupriavidus campinensis]|uniref:ParB/RepB/Spo0J family partition protein n=1 Tax=Cupriavidus campinensis TaxID=151783 RepID=A0ABY3ESJ8_9BURK|nr:ParB N-terminal domain-containing protein [Cupriavidus campinensis]TSP13936.1 ParB/RepB/Spo0J family partition protein [Cupriavidus campinensis]